MLQRTLAPSFFLSSFFLLLSICLFCIWPIYIWLISPKCHYYCYYYCTGMHGYARVCTGSVGVSAGMHGYVGGCGCVWVWASVGGCLRLWAVVWDEFSEFLPENRVPTSADFNTYPIRIFYQKLKLHPPLFTTTRSWWWKQRIWTSIIHRSNKYCWRHWRNDRSSYHPG